MKKSVYGKGTKIVAFILLLAILLCGCGKSKTDIEKTADKTAAYLKETVPAPGVGSVGGEWIIIGLTGYGTKATDAYFESYYQNLCAKLTEVNGVLDDRKNTEYSRVITALALMGKDPEDVNGYNLLEPLADYDQTVFQGINGAIWALIALNAAEREPPESTGVASKGSRDVYLNAILEEQNEDGGWGLSSDESSVDITAMALQALAPYKSTATDAIDSGLSWLSEQQLPNGGFNSYGSESLESIAQTVIALYELGLDKSDERFVKNDNTLEDALMRFYTGGGFCHNEGEDANEMATEQAFLAIVEILRSEKGEAPLLQSAV